MIQVLLLGQFVFTQMLLTVVYAPTIKCAQSPHLTVHFNILSSTVLASFGFQFGIEIINAVFQNVEVRHQNQSLR